MTTHEQKSLELADWITPTADNVPCIRDLNDAAAELRRLAAVEAELAALKEALRGLEPVAWAHPNGGFLSDHYINTFATGMEAETHNIPLFTLPPNLKGTE